MSEEWIIIEGFPDYMISDLGRVKSFKRYRESKILKLSNLKGYPQINLRRSNKSCHCFIHRLVLENFNPVEKIEELECNHKNGIKSYNILENLEWCTRSENMKHAFKLGLKNQHGRNNPFYGKNHSEKWKYEHRGENHHKSILTEKKVIDIKNDLKNGKLIQREIAKKFGVSDQTISDIKYGRRWKHLNET